MTNIKSKTLLKMLSRVKDMSSLRPKGLRRLLSKNNDLQSQPHDQRRPRRQIRPQPTPMTTRTPGTEGLPNPSLLATGTDSPPDPNQ
jgi:hypothetical protein